MGHHILGSIMLVLAVVMAVYALPRQILKNHKDARVGVTWEMIVLPLAVYSSRFAYALTIDAYYIAIPDGIGILFSSILLYQLLGNPRLPLLQRLEEKGWL